MKAPQSLCSGYKHVEAFGPEEEYEEEEVCYVTLDVGNVEPKLVPSSTAYRLIGLDTPTPFLQLQGTILQGRHDLLLGTELLFTDDKDTYGSKRSIMHVSTTEQRIAFQEVTLTPKKPPASGPEIKVNFEPPPPDDLDEKINRMTGLSAPRARGPRRKKTAPNAKGKEKATPAKSARDKKGKGKEKEREPSPPPPPPPEGIRMDEDAPGDDDDDMYMDIEYPQS